MRYLAVAFPESARSLTNLVESISRSIDGVFLLGGIPEPDRLTAYLQSLGLEIVGVTSSLDDHYAASILEKQGALVEGRLKALNGGLLVAGINGRDPATSIAQLREKLAGLEGRTIILGYHAPRGCGDKIPGLEARIGLWELKELIEKTKPLLYITSRSPLPEACKIGSTLVLSIGWLQNRDYTVLELPLPYWEHKKTSSIRSPKHIEPAPRQPKTG